MKRNRTIIEVFATLLLTALITDSAIPISAAATKPKSAGRTTSAIANTILNGKGAPLSTAGIDGDFYIDTRSLLIYGPKKIGKWPLPQSLQGPAGIPGVDGKNGSEGKTISNASTVAGPTGAQGEKGEKGDKGEPGLPGGNGAPGPAGAKGDTGATGPQGATGPSGGGGGTTGPAGPTGATGAKGDTGATGVAGAQGLIGLTGAKGETGTAGSNGATGATGSAGAVGATGATGATGSAGAVGAKGDAGAVGAKGDTGAVGATGPSNVYRGTFVFPDISGGAGTSQSASLSGFKSGLSYLVEVGIVVYQPTRNIDNSLPLGLTVTNNVGTASIWYKYQTSKGRSYRNGAASERYEYTAIVQIVLDGTSSVDYSISLQLSVGIDTTTYLARSDASFTATLVGAVGTL